jgi:glyoxylase-like metal-dependent hydrolase (beta-lactamase superfamily II)
MDVTQIAPGLWRWTARHPEWTPDQGGPEGWEPEVASFYCEADGDALLIDPLVPADNGERERFWRALDRDVGRGAPHVLLTCAWHARSSADVLARYRGVRLWVHAQGVAELRDAGIVATDPFFPGDPLPGGASALDAVVGDGEVLLWLPSHAALVAGDTLLGGGQAGVRLCPDSWLGDADAVAVRERLRARLHDLPVERVLVTHGESVLAGGREALDRALA